MSRSSENFSLFEPAFSDPADIEAINSGVTEKVDRQMYKNRTVSAKMYDPTQTYDTTDHRYAINPNDDLLYRCLEDDVTGAWDVTKWEQTDLAAEIIAGGGGGASTLADLTDTDIDSPADGQALIYNEDDEVWENQTLPDPSVTKEASGNPIEISDSASAPLVKCVSAITGSQNLHGYDKPWVGGAGVNLARPNRTDPTTVQGITVSVNKDNGENVLSYGLRGTTTGTGALSYFNFPVKSVDTTYYIKYFEIPEYLSKFGWDQTASGQINVQGNTVTIPANHSCSMGAYINIVGADIDGILQVSISETEMSDFAPYSNICPITAYTEGEIEVRGKNLFDSSTLVNNKTLDQTTGLPTSWNGRVVTDSPVDVSKLTNVIVTYSYTGAEVQFIYSKFRNGNLLVRDFGKISGFVIDVSDADELYISWYRSTDITMDVLSNIQIESGSSATDYEPYTSTTHTTTYPSAIYRGSEDVVNGEVTSEWVVSDMSTLNWTYDSVNNFFYTFINVRKPGANFISSQYNNIGEKSDAEMSGVDDGSIASNRGGKYVLVKDTRFNNATDFTNAMVGVQIVYELETPTTSSVTPTNLPIKSLNGYNHIESSTGDMEIEYITEDYQPIVDLIESNKHVYSTAEQIVGTWIDGKTVYEKTVVNEMALSQTWTNYIDASDIDTIISVEERCERDGEDVPAPFSFNEVASWIRRDNYIKVCITSNSSDWKILSLTIRYTKATAQTRTLSLSKGEISEVKKKADETPIEEEKPAENDLDEWLEESEEIEDEEDGLEEDPDEEEIEEPEEEDMR